MAVQQTFNINLRTNKIFISSKNQLIVSVINLTNELAEIKVNTMYHILWNGAKIDINIITPNNAVHSAVAFIFATISNILKVLHINLVQVSKVVSKAFKYQFLSLNDKPFDK